MAVTEQPLIFTNGDESKWFRFEAAPPSTAEGFWHYPIYESNIAYGKPDGKWDGSEIGGGWTGTGGTKWQSDSGLPPGHESCWVQATDGHIETVIEQIGTVPKNASFTVAAYVYLPENLRSNILCEMTYDDGSYHHASLKAGPTVGPTRRLSSWQPLFFSMTTMQASESVKVTISGGVQGMKVIGLTLRSIENEHRPWAYCGSAKNGHLSGLWSLPDMLGDIKSNVLFGGGLAPANPQYGPRPISYVIYVAGSSRSSTMGTIRDFLGFLAEGNVSCNNNGYGWTGRGWVASPPSTEWIGNETQIAKLSFTMTYLEPRIMPTNIFTDNWVGDFFANDVLWEYSSDEVFSSGWQTEPGTVSITNTTNAPIWPVFGIKYSGSPEVTLSITLPDVGITMQKLVQVPGNKSVVFNSRAFTLNDTDGTWCWNAWTGADGTRPGPVDMVIQPGETRRFSWTSMDEWAVMAILGKL